MTDPDAPPASVASQRRDVGLTPSAGWGRAFLFPGQGAQFQGMGEALFASALYPPELEARVDSIVGYSLRAMCLAGSEEDLRRTSITQPCLFVVNALHYLQELDDGPGPDVLAGHSLGEFNALWAAGAFDLETGLRLVARRGALMEAAPAGGMAAVLGLDAQQVRTVLDASGLEAIDIANFNSPRQVVLSGPAADLKRASLPLDDAGASYVRLPVGAPFHSRYMREPADAFAEALRGAPIAPLRIPVIANVNARPYEDPAAIPGLLVEQMTSQVQWGPTIEYLSSAGVTEFVETGPGDVLTKLLRHILPPAEA